MFGEKYRSPNVEPSPADSLGSLTSRQARGFLSKADLRRSTAVRVYLNIRGQQPRLLGYATATLRGRASAGGRGCSSRKSASVFLYSFASAASVRFISPWFS